MKQVFISLAYLWILQTPGFAYRFLWSDLPEDTISVHTISVTADYTSDNAVYGTVDREVSQPNFSAIISYHSGKGTILSSGYSRIENSDTSLSSATYQFDFSIGYHFGLPLNLYLDGSYTKFFYSKNTVTIRSRFEHQMELDAGYDGKLVTSGLTSYYLIGSSEEFLLNFHLSLNLFRDDFPFRNVSIGCMPELDIMMSNQQFYNEYLLQQFMAHPLYYFYRWKKMGYDRDKIKRLLLEEKKFAFTSMVIMVPISVLWKNVMFSGGVSFLKPLNQPFFLDDSWITMYNFNFSYLFVW